MILLRKQCYTIDTIETKNIILVTKWSQNLKTAIDHAINEEGALGDKLPLWCFKHQTSLTFQLGVDKLQICGKLYNPYKEEMAEWSYKGDRMDINVQFNVTLPIKITKRKKWFVASCPVLDVHSQGETEKKAKNNLIEALGLFFLSCFERGTLDGALKGCGFKAVHHVNPLKKQFQPAKDFIDVPIPFLVSQPINQHSCHA